MGMVILKPQLMGGIILEQSFAKMEANMVGQSSPWWLRERGLQSESSDDLKVQ